MDDIPYVKTSEVYEHIVIQGMPLVKVKSKRCDLVYGSTGDNIVTLLRCIPHERQLLYEVGGTYAKTKPNTYRNFLAESAKEAKERYKQLFGWNATACRYIEPGDEAEIILTDPLRMPL